MTVDLIIFSPTLPFVPVDSYVHCLYSTNILVLGGFLLVLAGITSKAKPRYTYVVNTSLLE